LDLVSLFAHNSIEPLKLRADQDDLVAPVAWSLADAYTMPDIAWPRLIYDGDQLVGFIMAAFAPGHKNPLFHSYLWRLNIDAGHQGKGYGRFAVEELCQEGIRRGHQRLTVSYHAGQPLPSRSRATRGAVAHSSVLPVAGLGSVVTARAPSAHSEA
jgi:GNAT superfamily N-acetyltransferase